MSTEQTRSTKTGPVLAISCNQCQELAKQIDAIGTHDEELIGLANHLRTFRRGFATVCVAEEDFILWPGGPDIRDFQIGGGKGNVTVIIGDEEFSNNGGMTVPS